MNTAIETIRRRVDALGTTEPNIVRQGTDRIVVQAPGLADPKILKELIGKTAKLTFQFVHPDYSDAGPIPAAQAKQVRPPPGAVLLPSQDGADAFEMIEKRVIVSGEDLVDAQPGFDQRTNEPVVNFRFNQVGARRFGKATQENVNRRFAIVLDNKVISAPSIREPILGGSGQISGRFTVQSANNLAILLRSGALPASLAVIEERSVGPSLGADSIAAGKIAAVIAVCAVAAFMMIAYGLFGFFSIISLMLNVMLIMGIMTAMQSTLTLPGIAGIVLTMGMAVDANVLIYERMREELRNGKSAINAMESGFQRAMGTIVDSQLTTLIAGVILFWLGSGPIRGFGVTLTIGLITSVFTAVIVTRLIIAFWLRRQRSARRDIVVPV
jgi:preprotein translocase subunit SecD